jgi:hypothetical protein
MARIRDGALCQNGDPGRAPWRDLRRLLGEPLQRGLGQRLRGHVGQRFVIDRVGVVSGA